MFSATIRMNAGRNDVRLVSPAGAGTFDRAGMTRTQRRELQRQVREAMIANGKVRQGKRPKRARR